MKRVGILMSLPEKDPEIPARQVAIRQGLMRKDVAFYSRYGGGDFPYDSLAQELVDLDPDVFFATCGPSFGALQAKTTKPIVFAAMVKPGGPSPFVGTNATGYFSYDYGICEKWLKYLMEMNPKITQVAVIADQDRRVGIKKAIPINATDTDAAITSAVQAFAKEGNAGLVVPTSTKTATRRDLIINLAANNQLPAIYSNRVYINSGGLFCYGAKTLDVYRNAAGYVDRILNGEAAERLPMQVNKVFELVINTNTAKALGVTVPPSLLGSADEVI